MSNVYESKHPLVKHKLSRLRDVRTEPKKFHELVREIAAMLADEATADLATMPREWDYQKAKGKGADWAAAYFNECMTGFEYQVAGHMIAEGMLTEGLAIDRTNHDRYHPARRNPWNEVECGDHYARAMASYGVFLGLCGFEYRGPEGHLGFALRLRPERFKAAFTGAEGWGTLAQQIEPGSQTAEVGVKWGRLPLRSLALELPADARVSSTDVTVGRRKLGHTIRVDGRRLMVVL